MHSKCDNLTAQSRHLPLFVCESVFMLLSYLRVSVADNGFAFRSVRVCSYVNVYVMVWRCMCVCVCRCMSVCVDVCVLMLCLATTLHVCVVVTTD